MNRGRTQLERLIPRSDPALQPLPLFAFPGPQALRKAVLATVRGLARLQVHLLQVCTGRGPGQAERPGLAAFTRLVDSPCGLEARPQ